MNKKVFIKIFLIFALIAFGMQSRVFAKACTMICISDGGGSYGRVKYTKDFDQRLRYYLMQFSDTPQASDDGFYQMINDGAGLPTLENEDLCWRACYTYFENQPGYVSKDGKTKKYVSNIREWVTEELGGDNKVRFDRKSKDIENLNIYVEKKVVISVANKIRKEHYNYVKNKTKDLNLTEAQLFALTELSYAGDLGRTDGISAFITAYKTGESKYGKNTYLHMKYLWDNYWYKLAECGSYSNAKVKSMDATFETFVKGQYDFNDSYNSRTIFNRTTLKFFTQEQVKKVGATASFNCTRTLSNDKNTFEYCAQ